MQRLLSAAVLLLICTCSFSQKTFSLKGKVIDEATKLPIESATVYLSSAKDSTVIDYTITSKSGNFDLKIRKIASPVYLKISFVTYEESKIALENVSEDKDFGTISIKEMVNNLNEVVIKKEAPPIRIKKDTLEFNASSFKVRPDANVETLLRQLPGVEIDEEGKITVNGKEVNQILVNGKPFFGKDGKIATQNLPAEIINKVQVVDTKTKSEEISGDAASSNEKTINLTIDEEKNKGFFGKVMGGYGSSKRYESSLLLNSFKGEQKISAIASSNNINSVGFSMDEIFDNMGGGRNMSVYYNDDGSFGLNNMRFNTNEGITQSDLIGINYQDKWLKKIDSNGSYYYSDSDTKNENRTQRINLLPTGRTTTFSNSDNNTMTNAHNLSFDFEVEIDSTTSLSISPKLEKNRSKNRFSRNQLTQDQTNSELNRSNSSSFSDNENSEAGVEMNFVRRFKRKNRGMAVNFDTSYQKRNNFLDTRSETVFQDATPNISRNQNSYDVSRDSYIRGEIRYGEPLTDSLRLSLTSEIVVKKNDDELKTFDYSQSQNDYSIFNAEQSNLIGSKTVSYFASTGLIVNKAKLNGRINFGPEFINFDNNSYYLGAATAVNRNYVYPKIRGYLNYTIGKSKSLYMNYNYEVNLPSANQILPVENLSNPLNTIKGNEDLKPSKGHSMYINFNNYDYATRSGFFAYGGFDYDTDVVVSSTVFDANFRSVTTYENVDKSMRANFGCSFDKSFKKEKRTLKFGLGANISYNLSQGLTNLSLYESHGMVYNPRLSMSWSIDQLITISPSYRYTYFKTRYSNYDIDEANNFLHKAKIEITGYFPKKFVFGNDIGYTFNSQITDGFKKDFFLWNVSLGYNFWKDQFLAKVKVYDLLNQNLNSTRSITSTAIVDAENTVLRRYVMFSLTYKLEKFAGKKKDNGIQIID